MLQIMPSHELLYKKLSCIIITMHIVCKHLGSNGTKGICGSCAQVFAGQDCHRSLLFMFLMFAYFCPISKMGLVNYFYVVTIMDGNDINAFDALLVQPESEPRSACCVWY